MHATFPHGLWHREPKETLISKPHTLVVVSVERGGVDGWVVSARELGAAWGKHVFHWLLPKDLCIAWSKSLNPTFHRL